MEKQEFLQTLAAFLNMSAGSISALEKLRGTMAAVHDDHLTVRTPDGSTFDLYPYQYPPLS